MAAPRAASRRPTSPETSEVRYCQIRKVSLNLILCKYLDVSNLLLPGLDTTITSSLSAPATEFTELSSRKTSNVSSFFQSQLSKSSWLSSSNPYEDTLLQTKDEQTDRWEFPRHHLKFYGILGESLNLQA